MERWVIQSLLTAMRGVGRGGSTGGAIKKETEVIGCMPHNIQPHNINYWPCLN